MGSNSVLQVKGFEELLEKVQKAEGNIKEVTTKMANESVDIICDELKSAAIAAGVPSSVTDEITKEKASWHGNRCEAGAGWKLGSFNPDNPSQGYKAIFLNYGTPRRSKHGQVQGRFFIKKAKTASKKKVKKAQENALKEITGELND